MKSSIASTMAALLDSPGFKILVRRLIIDSGTFAVTGFLGSSGEGNQVAIPFVFPGRAGIVFLLIIVVLL